MNEYFVNVTKSLNIPDVEIEKHPINSDIQYMDPVDQIIYNYSKHPSILKTKEMIKHEETFTFQKVTES